MPKGKSTKKVSKRAKEEQETKKLNIQVSVLILLSILFGVLIY